MFKTCPRCKLKLDQSKFNWKIKNVHLAAYCKECSRKYIKDHYSENTEYYINKAKKRNIVQRAIVHEYLRKYLESHPCVDCDEADILVLEFDHIDSNEKIMEVSKFIRLGVGLDKIIAEVNKCEVRCANCHRRKTARENNSWKLKLHP